MDGKGGRNGWFPLFPLFKKEKKFLNLFVKIRSCPSIYLSEEREREKGRASVGHALCVW